jgi:hypothetical protein
MAKLCGVFSYYSDPDNDADWEDDVTVELTDSGEMTDEVLIRFDHDGQRYYLKVKADELAVAVVESQRGV